MRSPASQMERTGQNERGSSLWCKPVVSQPRGWLTSPAQEAGEAGPAARHSTKKPGSAKEAGMVLSDNHLPRGPAEPGWCEVIHGWAAPGLLAGLGAASSPHG